MTTHLVIALISTTELGDQANEHELADLRKLGVHNGDEGSEDGSEGEGRRLRPHNRARKEALSANEVLAKELRNDVLDVGDVDLGE